MIFARTVSTLFRVTPKRALKALWQTLTLVRTPSRITFTKYSYEYSWAPSSSLGFLLLLLLTGLQCISVQSNESCSSLVSRELKWAIIWFLSSILIFLKHSNRVHLQSGPVSCSAKRIHFWSVYIHSDWLFQDIALFSIATHGQHSFFHCTGFF